MAIRGTTPDYILTVKGVDLRGMSVIVTIRQGNRELDKGTGDLLITSDGTDSVIALTLSQEDTLYLQEGAAAVQVKFIDVENVARGTDIQTINVNRALYERVIEYAAGD